MKNIIHIIIVVVTIFIGYTFINQSFAGPLTPSANPASTLYTLDGIYNKIISNSSNVTEGVQSFVTPATASSSFHSLKQIYESIPTLDASKIKFGKVYMGVTGILFPVPGLPKTGQITCSDNSDPVEDEVPCNGGEDGYYQSGVLVDSPGHFRFEVDVAGVLRDISINIMWKKCTEGQSGSDCSGGGATAMNWSTALTTCEADTTGGYTDWRLPNRTELLSLLDYRLNRTLDPVIDTDYFPNTLKGNYYTSTSYQITAQAAKAWIVDFSDGSSVAQNKNNTYYVRCVR